MQQFAAAVFNPTDELWVMMWVMVARDAVVRSPINIGGIIAFSVVQVFTGHSMRLLLLRTMASPCTSCSWP
ncbi:hypothetical protein NB231_14518 [Nitrococcus mobilis Nb-231]|uniref:Uncharacterized protein n=1 Tax=Nitrococcus mobilis Nb-231 TaxID=314278 RepID=A4BL54_9GAMM|nr:hypothetical protein NB231_14518 [Nitrococcus mobilis Nb-231]